MKIIFLDVDGVLNSAEYEKEHIPPSLRLDRSRLPLLRELVIRSGARIVLSSTLRLFWDKSPTLIMDEGSELQAALAEYGLEIYDKTPYLKNTTARAEEIREWLHLSGDTIDEFVILDDTKDGWGDLLPHTVITDYFVGRGLEARHVADALKALRVST